MAVRTGRPTISCIYAAFDTASQRVFRRSMEICRGSVVRVADLLMALHELEIPSGIGVVPDGWHPALRTNSHEPWLTPMSNDPALRTLLEQSYSHAQAGGQPIVIKPRQLWEAAVSSGHIRRTNPQIQSQQRRPLAAPIGQNIENTINIPSDELIDEVFQKWVFDQMPTAHRENVNS